MDFIAQHPNITYRATTSIFFYENGPNGIVNFQDEIAIVNNLFHLYDGEKRANIKPDEGI